jgi:hypothetical protein
MPWRERRGAADIVTDSALARSASHDAADHQGDCAACEAAPVAREV